MNVRKPCIKHGKLLVLIHSINIVNDEYDTEYRPYVKEFLGEMEKMYNIMIWTAASSRYALPIVSKLFEGLREPFLIYTYEKCTKKLKVVGDMTYEMLIVKKLSKIKSYPMNRILVVDDISSTFSNNVGNGILIPKWKREKEDKYLYYLSNYLKLLVDVDNVISIDKTNWIGEQTI